MSEEDLLDISLEFSKLEKGIKEETAKVRKELEELRQFLEEQRKEQERADKEHERLFRLIDLMFLQQNAIQEMQLKRSSNP